MDQASPDKLCDPKPILLRLSPRLAARLEDAAEATGKGRQEIIRDGLDEKLTRIESETPGIPAETARQVLVAIKRNYDVGKILADAMAADDTAKAASA